MNKKKKGLKLTNKKRTKCEIPGCRCHERYPFSYHKSGNVVEPLPDLAPKESEEAWKQMLKEDAKKQRRIKYLNSPEGYAKEIKKMKAKYGIKWHLHFIIPTLQE